MHNVLESKFVSLFFQMHNLLLVVLFPPFWKKIRSPYSFVPAYYLNYALQTGALKKMLITAVMSLLFWCDIKTGMKDLVWISRHSLHKSLEGQGLFNTATFIYEIVSLKRACASTCVNQVYTTSRESLHSFAESLFVPWHDLDLSLLLTLQFCALYGSYQWYGTNRGQFIKSVSAVVGSHLNRALELIAWKAIRTSLYALSEAELWNKIGFRLTPLQTDRQRRIFGDRWIMSGGLILCWVWPEAT